MNVHYQTLQDARLFRDFPDDVLIDLAKAIPSPIMRQNHEV